MVEGPQHILIVDDEPLVGIRLKQSLEPHGYRIDTALSGREAVKKVQEGHFDAVVTDIRMDDIDGIEVLNQVQALSPGTHVIIITGYATIELAREALAKGAFDFIAKPFKPSQLRDVLVRCLKPRVSPA